MKTLEITGLKGVDNTVTELQQLLADMHIYYMNLRSFHWNVQGNKFFSLHNKYEEMYDGISDEIDEVAERILTLGKIPQSTLTEYLKNSKVKEAGVVSDAAKTVEFALEGMKVLINQLRKISDVAAEANDKVSEDMVVGYLEGHEKTVWMLTAFLK